MLQIPEQDETYLEDSFCVGEESCKSQSSEEVCVDFNITEDSFTNGSKKYKTRGAVKLKQMKRRQNDTRTKKKSRIILQDDSSEEENNINDKSHNVIKPSTVHKSAQSHCLNLAPFTSSQQSNNHSESTIYKSPKQRQRIPFDLKDTVSDALDFKSQNYNKMDCTSSSFTAVALEKDTRKFPLHFKVWRKTFRI